MTRNPFIYLLPVLVLLVLPVDSQAAIVWYLDNDPPPGGSSIGDPAGACSAAESDIAAQHAASGQPDRFRNHSSTWTIETTLPDGSGTGRCTVLWEFQFLAGDNWTEQGGGFDAFSVIENPCLPTQGITANMAAADSSFCDGQCVWALDGVGVSFPPDFELVGDFTQTAAECSVDTGTGGTFKTQDNSSVPPVNTVQDSEALGGIVDQYDAPIAPAPVDAVELNAETDSASGATITEYESDDGSTIFVITDSAGNVLFTDVNPTTGSTTYAIDNSGSTSGGGTDSGTSTSGGTTDGSTTSGSTTSGGTTSGTTTDGGTTDGDVRVSAGGFNCDSAPTCAGDAIDCAVVQQTWNTRCEAQELKDDLLTEVDQDIFSNSGPGQAIEAQMEQFGNDLGDIEGTAATALKDAAALDVDDMFDSIPLAGACSMSFLNIELMGAQFPMGQHFCDRWTVYEPVLEFGMWAMAVVGIYLMWFGAITRTTV